MPVATLDSWLESLGYVEEPAVLHLRGRSIPGTHPYAQEIRSILRPEGAIKAQAVFDVEGVPTVVFVGDDEAPLSKNDLDRIRQKIWNQNLVSVVIQLEGESARAFPARKLERPQLISLNDAKPDGPFSALDVASSNLLRRLPNWFDIKERVDRKLLANLSATVEELSRSGFRALEANKRRLYAELLMGQVLFVSYLEHRNIVGQTYRERRSVKQLHDLVAKGNREEIRTLIESLHEDFNGDFLSDDCFDPWSELNDGGFVLINSFLSRTDMETGQGDFWNYDFSYIPVELLSGLYESFLSHPEQEQDGAYYTPRHLAMLAVDQTFAVSEDPLTKTIFDGACGSGILLTTAFRRLISLAETDKGSQLGFKERITLLKRHIFGADINLMACRVTAFSLYLSLLEDLDPADIMEAQERDAVVLPPLDGTNLRHGKTGDFFATEHGFSGRKFDLIISNPPWKEPEAKSVTSADKWVKQAGVPFVRRQIAGAYAIRALDFLSESGRLCLILPISLLLAPTSGRFVTHILKHVKPVRLINFGDLQNLLFPTNENTCHLLVSIGRSESSRGIPFDETFEYYVPKADLSLAYGRLTMQSADRHAIQTISVSQDPQILTTLMWGDINDLSLWTRLTSHGTLGQFEADSDTSARWVFRKGVHFTDNSRPPVSSRPFHNKPFVTSDALRGPSPVLYPTDLTTWPKAHAEVASADDELFRVFDGPRVLFTDGFSRQDLSIRASYFDGPATFTVSIAAIASTKADAALLRFTAAFLRSSLARYFLMMRGWKMLSGRNAVHLADVKTFPLFSAHRAPDPEAAQKALDRVEKRMVDLAQLAGFYQTRGYLAARDAFDFDEDVFDFFSLSTRERSLVRETVGVLMPSIRPRGFKSLDTPIQQTAQPGDLSRYAQTLTDTLTEWRERTEGKGRFHVSVVTGVSLLPCSVGVVRIDYTEENTAPGTSETQADDEAVGAALAELRQSGLTVIPSANPFQLIPDAHVWANGALYLARLLTKRNWTLRQALRDAEYIVRMVQRRQRTLKGHEAA